MIGLLREAGVEALLVKGPVIGDWLYAGDVRPYGDSDLLVPARGWESATQALERTGFHEVLGGTAEHPRMDSAASKAFARGTDNVDLHRSLDGLRAPAERVWERFARDAITQRIGGREVRVPSRPLVLMHIALHAAHHGDAEKVLEDLRRGLEHAGAGQWREAADAAGALDGLPAFASGLRRLPEGAALADALGLAQRSVRHDIRAANVPIAEGVHELLSSGLSTRERGALVGRELVPRPAFMRWWSPVARRGRGGLLASYPIRWAWLVARAPAALRAVRAARRAR